MQSDRTRKNWSFLNQLVFFFKLSVGFSAFETYGSMFKLTRRRGIMDYCGKKSNSIVIELLKNFIQLKIEHISFSIVLLNKHISNIKHNHLINQIPNNFCIQEKKTSLKNLRNQIGRIILNYRVNKIF